MNNFVSIIIHTMKKIVNVYIILRTYFVIKNKVCVIYVMKLMK